MNPLLLDSATELARKIRDGEVTSREVTQVHIDRIRDVNPTINAMVADRFNAALEEADEADAVIRQGHDVPPLHGVPCTIKESFAVRGMPWTGGLKARVGTTADDDAITVRRFREAGAIVMGVTNLSELCMWMESDNPVYGRTSNPYDVRRIAGGSSGGEGAIIGAGGSPFGLGADVGGSIRMPAFFNGVFGHKPGSRVVPNTGQFPINHSAEGNLLLATGPLCRHAEDLMPLLRILAGPDGEDPVCEPPNLPDTSTVAIDGLQVLIVPDNGVQKVDPELRAAIEKAGSTLGNLGAKVDTRRFKLLKQSFDIWSTAMGDAEGDAAFRKLLRRPRKRDLVKHLLRPAQIGGDHTLPATILGLVEDVSTAFPGRAEQHRRMRAELRGELIDAMGDGVLLFPPYPKHAPRHREPLMRPFSWIYTAVFNAMGFPVTQVPLGLNRKGVPVGVQVVGKPGNDHVTIAVAEALAKDGVARWVPPWAG